MWPRSTEAQEWVIGYIHVVGTKVVRYAKQKKIKKKKSRMAGNGGKQNRFNDITLFSMESSIYFVKGTPFLQKLFVSLLRTAPITGKRIMLDDCPPGNHTVGVF